MGGCLYRATAKMVCLRFLGQDSEINLNQPHPEFSAWQWVERRKLPDLIVPLNVICTNISSKNLPIIECAILWEGLNESHEQEMSICERSEAIQPVIDIYRYSGLLRLRLADANLM